MLGKKSSIAALQKATRQHNVSSLICRTSGLTAGSMLWSCVVNGLVVSHQSEQRFALGFLLHKIAVDRCTTKGIVVPICCLYSCCGQ